MDYKYPWQEEWIAAKEEKLQALDSAFPDPHEDLTITTLNQLPGIDRRTTFSFDSVGQARDAFAGEIEHDIYLRLSNPTIRCLEDMVTLLEARHFFESIAVPGLSDLLSKAPVKTLAFSCGMAAISHTLLALLNPGDVMLTDKVLYGCSDNLVNVELKNKGIRIVEVDASDLNLVERAFEQNPEAKLIYFETPANPTLGLRDIKRISEIAAKYHALVVVDNTFATPYLQNPLKLGADIVVHSLTKYINGHGDVLGGSVTGSTAFISGNWPGGLFYARRIYGGVMDPAQSMAILKGIVSLPLRMEKHCDNAERVVAFLSHHPVVRDVYYPSLQDSEIAKSQMRRYGGMVAFEIKGDLDATSRVIDAIADEEIGYIAVSLGLPYTLFEHPAGMTHYFVAPQERRKKGITDTLIRLSTGLEDSEKIVETLGNILEKTG